MQNITKRRLGTVALGAAGTALFVWIGLPLPFLFGPLVACLVAALAGVPVAGAGKLGTLMRTVLGVAIGESAMPTPVAWSTNLLVFAGAAQLARKYAIPCFAAGG